MKFTWKYRYVKEGQLEPDDHGRWAIDCFIDVHIEKVLPQYDWLKKLGRKHIAVRVATIGLTRNIHFKYYCAIPSFDDAGNTGFSTSTNFNSNKIEDLKKQIEAQFLQMQKVFKYCR